MSAQPLGRLGEDSARQFLERDGWLVRAVNYRAGREEVDLIVERAGVLAFVEVKTRSESRMLGSAFDAIDARKRARIRRVAAHWIRNHDFRGDTVRFDAIAVIKLPNGAFTLEHVPDAWR